MADHNVDPGVAGLAHLKGLVDFLEKSGHRDMPEVVRAREYLTALEPPPKAEPKAEPRATSHNK